MKNDLSEFTNRYSLSKTLRFELIPQPGTEKLVRNPFEKPEENHHEIIRKDLELSWSYKEVKKLIDCRHRSIIDDVLNEFKFTEGELKLLNQESKEKEEENSENETEDKDRFVNLRKRIADALNEKAKDMFESKLVDPKKDEKCELEIWMNRVDEKYLELNRGKKIDTATIVKDIKKMEGFFTYFGGFNNNRENVYSKDKIATAIPFRIVHDNFPIFKKNIENYNKIKKEYPELAKLIDEKGADEIFKLEYFNYCLTQAGIDIYNVERLGIVAREQGKEQAKGINQIINEYVQKENKLLKEKGDDKKRKIRVATFDKLKKQILSINKSKSFHFEVLEDTPHVIKVINECWENLHKVEDGISVFDEVKNFIANIPVNNLDEIYLNEKSISIISKKLFGYGRQIEFALEKWYDEKKSKEENVKRTEKQKIIERKKFLDSKQFSIMNIEESIKFYFSSLDKNIPEYKEILEKYKDKEHPIIEYFKNPSITIKIKEGENEKQIEKPLFIEFEERRKNIDYILNGSYTNNLKEEKDSGGDSEKVKAFLDALLEFNYLLSPFFVKDKNLGKDNEKDDEFYNERKRLHELLFDVEILELYNQTRNYITQKPYKLDKFKMNFDRSYFLSGWSNEIKEKEGLILIRETGIAARKEYYLIIPEMPLSIEERTRLLHIENDNDTKICFYEFQKMDMRNFPRMFINSTGDTKSPSIKKYNLPIETIWDDYQNYRKRDTKGKAKFLSENPNFRHRLIDYFKVCAPHHESLAPFKSLFSSVWKRTEDYSTLADFYQDTLEACYNLKIENINFKVIQEFASSGKLHLFKIHNKDYNPGSNGTKNLHTLYWEMLFDQKNLENVTFKLNGGAELFYREATILKNKTIHKIGEKVPKKFFELPDGKLEPVPAQSIKNLNAYYRGDNVQLTKVDKTYIDNYSIIKHEDRVKDNRFTKDKLQFHCSITMNFKPTGKKNINDEVLRFLHKRDDVHIIGLDRGERNLIYLTMINKQGKIIEQGTLNEIERKFKVNDQDRIQKIDYHQLLHSKEGNRAEARKNWQTIENIKELKEGYLSLVVHQLAKLVVEKKAIIVLEDLNYGFKDSRAKVEKQIYQKFEKMLIDKLNYLVLDKKNIYNDGGVLHGYQLTNQVDAYKDMGKQCGFLFYVPADYTSKICPVTGFVNLLRPKYTNRNDAVDFFQKFEKIYYDTSNNYFRFEFDYIKFDKLRVDVRDLERTKWSVCSHPAIRSMAVQVNNKWHYEKTDVNEKLKELFEGKISDYQNGESLIDAISKIVDAKFFEKLFKLFAVLLALRHTWKEKIKDGNGNEIEIEHDTIVSSVELVKGSNDFFVSKEGNDLPANADANGAFNIARKGLWLLEELDKINVKVKDDKGKEIIDVSKFNELKYTKEVKKEKRPRKGASIDEKPEKKRKESQWIPNKEWLQFVQQKPFK